MGSRGYFIFGGVRFTAYINSSFLQRDFYFLSVIFRVMNLHCYIVHRRVFQLVPTYLYIAYIFILNKTRISLPIF